MCTLPWVVAMNDFVATENACCDTTALGWVKNWLSKVKSAKVRIQQPIWLPLRFLFLQEIVDMERYIERVKKSIADKEPPLKVAETRLKKRTQAGSGNFPPWKKTISLPKQKRFSPWIFFINFSMQHLLSMITILDSFSWLQQALYNIPPKVFGTN